MIRDEVKSQVMLCQQLQRTRDAMWKEHAELELEHMANANLICDKADELEKLKQDGQYKRSAIERKGQLATKINDKLKEARKVLGNLGKPFLE